MTMERLAFAWLEEPVGNPDVPYLQRQERAEREEEPRHGQVRPAAVQTSLDGVYIFKNSSSL